MEADVVQRAMTGDKEAFSALVVGLRDRLFAIAYRILRDRATAEDAVQQTFLIAWRELPKLRDASKFEAWLYRLLVNSCRAEMRNVGRWQPGLRLVRDHADPSDDAQRTVAQRDEIERAFRRLTAEQRSVLVLHHYVGLSGDEIGVVLGLPPGTVRSRLHYARQLMRSAIEAEFAACRQGRRGMTRQFDFDSAFETWLADGPTEMAEHAARRLDRAIADIDMRRPFWLPRRETMNRFVIAAGSVAAVVLLVVLGFGLASGGGMFGPAASSSPTPTPTLASTPTPAPTATPVPTPTPMAVHGGELSAGNYVAHPFGEPNSAMGFKFTVPNNSWVGYSSDRTAGIYSDRGGVGFLRVASLNGDPCNWSGTADDVAIGATVDDLVSALTSSTEYETSVPTDVTLAGYTGKQVVVTMPTLGGSGENYSTDCDEQAFLIWNAEGFTIHSQGPGDRWRLYILDVEGDRVVILAHGFEGTSSNLREELRRSWTRSRSPHRSSREGGWVANSVAPSQLASVARRAWQHPKFPIQLRLGHRGQSGRAPPGRFQTSSHRRPIGRQSEGETQWTP